MTRLATRAQLHRFTVAMASTRSGFKANVSLPYTSNFGVARLDHDFGSKFHFNSSYRYYTLYRTTTSQVDIGGFFPGDTFGHSRFPSPTVLSSRGSSWQD